MSVQRRLNDTGRLSPERKARLDALGFIWDARDALWETRFSELQRYKERFGHCNVPHKWRDNPQLAKWVAHNRRFAKTGKLSSSHKARLTELGLELVPISAAWETMFAELKRYKDSFGHCNVPQGWAENPKLAGWVREQRGRNKEGKLSSERKARLDSLGFDWNTRDSGWERMFVELKRYKDAHGDCNVPRGSAEIPKLAAWVKMQRYLRKTGKLLSGRKARLDAIGFEWAPRP